MNKSTITNLIALGCVIIGLVCNVQYRQPILDIGLFALSGAITNWLAIYMLFEKVPGFYGSGVIPARFDDFKRGIHSLIMEEFFTKENFDKFFAGSKNASIDLEPIIDEIDMSSSFDALVSAIEESSFGGMLGMFGGPKVLEGLRKPLISKIKVSLKEIAKSGQFQDSLKSRLGNSLDHAEIHEKVEYVVKQRLNELTPQMVKDIIQKMIRAHLGWLVVWGGVLGGIIGLIAAYVPF